MMLVIETDNAAFEDRGPELARILRTVANRLDAGATSGSCVDVNGNTVGKWES